MHEKSNPPPEAGDESPVQETPEPRESREAAELIAKLKEQIQKQRVLLDLARLSASQFDLKRLLEIIVFKSTQVVDADRSTLFLLDERESWLWTIVAEGLERHNSFITIPLGQGLAGHVAESKEQVVIEDAYQDDRFDRTVDSRTGYRTRNLIATPLLGSNGQVLGVLEVINKRTGAFSQEDAEFLWAFASTAAGHVETANLYHDIESLFNSFVNVVALAVDERDPCTAGHSRRVKLYSRALADAINRGVEGPLSGLRFDEEDLHQLEIAALMHDVGKIGVRESVLNKRNRLTDENVKIILQRIDLYLSHRKIEFLERGKTVSQTDEVEVRETVAFIQRIAAAGFLSVDDAKRLWEIRARGWLDDSEYEHLAVTRGNLTKTEWEHMQTHAAKSHQLLSRIPWPKNLARVPEIAYCHHEKMNGHGYPRGVSGEQIPLESQIVMVADIYDALTAHDRPYKPPMPHERAAAILREQSAEGLLNAALVDVFLDREVYQAVIRGEG